MAGRLPVPPQLRPADTVSAHAFFTTPSPPSSNTTLVLLKESGAVGAAFLGAREAGDSIKLKHSDFTSVLYDYAQHPAGPPEEVSDPDTASALGLFAATAAVVFVRAALASLQA